MDVFIIIASLVGLVIGGHYFVAGAAALGRRFGMSQVLVGATIVAIGTSLPEWAISVFSSYRDNAELATANVVGSNLCNVCIILGIAALIRPLDCARAWLRRDGMIMILATFIFMFVSYDGVISRYEGMLLLALAITAIVVLARTSTEDSHDESSVEFHIWQIPLAVAGLVLMLVSCNFFVGAAENIATQFGVSPWLIGLTVAAIGTSLPELATACIASLKGHGGLVIGNVLGSNTMNILFVLGSASTVNPLVSDHLTPIASGTFVALMILPILFLRTNLQLNRWEALLLIVCGISWIAWSSSA